MKPVCLHAKDEIEKFLRQNTFLHLYEIGDLDDFFWQYTTWYALKMQNQIQQLVLLYTGTPYLPTLVGLTDEPANVMRELLDEILPFLPKRFYTHLSSNLVTTFTEDYHIRSQGTYYKMALTNRLCLEAVDTSNVIPLSVADWSQLRTLYGMSYPENWFDPRMLETGCYYGIRHGTDLVSVAGIHVYSQKYKVAALGNITTHPQFRGRGLATVVCAKLCQELLYKLDHIGLNVKSDNISAIACYQNLGFEQVATYNEYSLELK